MDTTEIKFRNFIYNVSTGDVFQAKVEHCTPGTIFILYSVEGAEVTVEVLEKISNNTALVRVNKIVWPDGELEWFEDIMKEPEYHFKSLKEMTKKELVQFSKEHNLDVNTKLNKKDLLKAIKESI